MEFKSIPPLDAGLTAAAAANGCVARRLQQNIAAALAVLCVLAHPSGLFFSGGGLGLILYLVQRSRLCTPPYRRWHAGLPQ